MKKFLNKIFRKNMNKRKNTFTIINENRKQPTRNIYLQNKNERQNSCLSKYFQNINGLNSVERNIYSKIF